MTHVGEVSRPIKAYSTKHTNVFLRSLRLVVYEYIKKKLKLQSQILNILAGVATLLKLCWMWIVVLAVKAGKLNVRHLHATWYIYCNSRSHRLCVGTNPLARHQIVWDYLQVQTIIQLSAIACHRYYLKILPSHWVPVNSEISWPKKLRSKGMDLNVIPKTHFLWQPVRFFPHNSHVYP